ncbi:MAG: molybdopterin oxidoreductase, partial [Firmicutes bacterium]|nr:molybdopterin oxidoreductase [Bacillota bacterium]
MGGSRVATGPRRPAGRPRLSRRALLTSSALLGGCALFPPRLQRVLAAPAPGTAPALVGPEHVLYSVCQQCNTQCGIKVRIEDGLIAKIDGSPYSPWTLNPHLPYATPVTEAAQVDGCLCPKGQAAVQTAYDPYRIVRVLKRAGRRGENRWISIPFEQAVSEIVEGGLLFANVPGEETRRVEGLRAIRAATDAEVMKALAADARKVA